MTTLVLVPGTLCDVRLWLRQIAALAGVANVRVASVTEDDSIEAMARRLLEQSPESFSLAGLSLGGIVAMEVARLAPERVSRLALLDTNPNPPRPEQLTAWRRQIEAVESGAFRDTVEREFLPMLLHPSRYADEALLRDVRGMIDAVGARAFAKQLRANAGRPGARDVLPQVRCPALVLAGRQDRLCPPEMQADLASLLPSAKLALIEECGHLSTMERPEEVAAAMREWLLTPA